jgi:predicted nucleic acid-binding protein
MRIMIDLNVLLDVFQKRQPHYHASAKLLDFALRNQYGSLSSHILPTCYYLVWLRRDILRWAKERREVFG